MKTKETINHIVNWIKEYVDSNNLNGLIVGISGGVDSALVSTLCAKTGLKTLCIEMPIHQDQNQVSRGKKHIEWLDESFANISALDIDLTATFETIKAAFPVTDNANLDLSLANTRARLRMTTLYYFAGLHGMVVVGTGNKIEDFGIGFYTKYGDGGVDINPIADLTKTEVFELAKFLEINTAILTAKPTDGLFGDERSDEDQIGATYPELEWAMEAFEKGKHLEDFTGREATVFKIFSDRHRVNQHKWLPIPTCKIPKDFKKNS